jgi:hypothetical protein
MNRKLVGGVWVLDGWVGMLGLREQGGIGAGGGFRLVTKGNRVHGILPGFATLFFLLFSNPYLSVCLRVSSESRSGFGVR